MNRLTGAVTAAGLAAVLAIAACAPRPGIVPLCEGVAYVAQSNHLAGLAIDALARSDLPVRDRQVSRARSSIDEARHSLDESRQDKTGDWTDESQRFENAIQLTSGTVELVSTGVAGDVANLRATLSDAETALTEIGPPSGCIPDPSYWVGKD